MKKRNIYYIINAVVLFVSMINPCCVIFAIYVHHTVWPSMEMLLLYFTYHFLCMFRLYLIFLEKKINFKRFIRVYFKTTLVNSLLPFKIGEIFKLYCFSFETGSYMWGIFGVLIERFFASSALLLIWIPSVFGNRVSHEMMLLFIIIVSILVLYWIFEPLYRYSNQFLILNTNSRRTPGLLKILEKINWCFLHIKKLLYGRSAVLLVVSCIITVMEITLFCKMNMAAVDVRFGTKLNAFSAAMHTSGLFATWNIVFAGVILPISYIIKTIQGGWKKGE